VARNGKKPRPRPEPTPAWAPTDLSRISAAGGPTSFRLTGERVEFDLTAQAAGADGRPALKKFSMTAYTGGAMDVGWGYPVVCDLEGLSVPSQANPILMAHDTAQIVGHSTRVDVGAQRIAVAGVVSGVGGAAAEVQALAANGFPWQASMGASVQSREFVDRGQTVKVNGRNFAGPVYVARRSTLGEVSFVAIGADQNTSAAIAAHQQQGDEAVNFNDWLKARGHDPARLTDAERNLLKATFDAEQRLAAANPPASPPPPAAPPPTPAPATDAGAAFQAELARQIQAGRDAAAAAELHALRAARPGRRRRRPGRLVLRDHGAGGERGGARGGRAARRRHQFRLEDDDFYTEPTPDGKGHGPPRAAAPPAEAQGGLKARYTDQVQQAAHTIFKGRIGLHQLLARGLRPTATAASST
jgi:hypothetical protein